MHTTITNGAHNMRKLNILIVMLIILSNIFVVACDNDAFGGMSINSTDTVVGGTVFDTKNLRLLRGDVRGDIDYSVKVIGSTTEVNDSTWNKWFGDEESDVLGKLVVCLKLKYDDKLANDPNATITLPDYSSEDGTKTFVLSEVQDGTVDNNFVYIILNPKHNQVTMVLTYTHNKTKKETRYLIDMVGVNVDFSHLQ